MSMRGDQKSKRPFLQEAMVSTLANLDETRARIHLAGLGLAAPMLSARAGQARREAARARVDRNASEEERVMRGDAAARAASALTVLHQETARAQVTPGSLGDRNNAVLAGRIVDGDKPAALARLVAEVDGKRIGHACADREGRFSIELPASTDLIFAIARGEGPIVHREKETMRFSAGQNAYHEFDLSDGTPPCTEPADHTPTYGVKDRYGTAQSAPTAYRTPPKAS